MASVQLATAFLNPPPTFTRATTSPSFSRSLYYTTANSNDDKYSQTECQEMRDLILSLSLEPTDHDRRTRVRDVFHEALAGPNGMPKRFTDLFNKILIEVGDEVQNEVKKKFSQDQLLEALVEDNDDGEASIIEDPATAGVEEEGEVVPPPKRKKSPEELQLWATVDMMIQTKTIVKKENGELGNEGTFQ